MKTKSKKQSLMFFIKKQLQYMIDRFIDYRDELHYRKITNKELSLCEKTQLVVFNKIMRLWLTDPPPLDYETQHVVDEVLRTKKINEDKHKD